MRMNGTARIGALAIGAMLALAAPASAQEKAGHDHGHAHTHAADDAVYNGYFEDSRIAPRALSDWEGDWQSVYPLLVKGALDPVMRHKAEHGGKTAEEYRAYYETGYRTDMDRIAIHGDQVSFHSASGTVTGSYAEDGYEVLTYEKGNRGVRYIFRKVAGDAGAPGFIQFSDHAIAPVKAGHYHLYWGDDRAALLKEVTNWPTYYPAALTEAQIVAEMQAH